MLEPLSINKSPGQGSQLELGKHLSDELGPPTSSRVCSCMAVHPDYLGSRAREGLLEESWGSSCFSASSQPPQDSAKKNWPAATLAGPGLHCI